MTTTPKDTARRSLSGDKRYGLVPDLRALWALNVRPCLPRPCARAAPDERRPMATYWTACLDRRAGYPIVVSEEHSFLGKRVQPSGEALRE
jgi:hypothetical protein